MGPRPSTEKALKECESTYKKGSQVEQRLVAKLHQNSFSIPILIDPKFLRKRDAGQVDACIYHLKKKKIYLIEIKKAERQRFFHRGQLRRLTRSAEILSQIIPVRSSLEYWFINKNNFAKKIKVF